MNLFSGISFGQMACMLLKLKRVGRQFFHFSRILCRLVCKTRRLENSRVISFALFPTKQLEHFIYSKNVTKLEKSRFWNVELRKLRI